MTKYLLLGKVRELLLHGGVEKLFFQALDGDREVQQGHFHLPRRETGMHTGCSFLAVLFPDPEGVGEPHFEQFRRQQAKEGTDKMWC